MGAAGGRDRPPVSNVVDQLERVSPTDVGDLPALPRGLHVAFNNALDLAIGSVVRLIALQPFVGDRLEAVGVRGFFARRIFALAHGLASVPPSIACFGQSHCWKVTERQPSQLAAVQPIEKSPRLLATVGDAQSEPWEALVEVVGLSLLGWFDADNGSFGKRAGGHTSGS